MHFLIEEIENFENKNTTTIKTTIFNVLRGGSSYVLVQPLLAQLWF